MAGTTDALRNLIRDHIFRTGTFTKPTNLYFALYTVAPTASGGGSEVSGGSYARVAVAVGDTEFNALVDGASKNINAITFPAPTADWGIIKAMAILDSASGGIMYCYDDTILEKRILNGDDAPSFGSLNFEFSMV